jgi:DNA-binding NtrC family response regulator
MASGKGGTVLIIDDDPEICDVLQFAVNSEGYEARVAENGDIALEIIADWRPSLVLLDYYGVDEEIGHFYESLRLIDPTIPVVLMTGAQEPGRKAKEMGVKQFIAKPFNVEALRKILRDNIRARPARPAKKRSMEFTLFS